MREIKFRGKYGDNFPKGMSECDDYGMFAGCDEFCPVFQRKQCEFQKELEEKWKKIFQQV